MCNEDKWAPQTETKNKNTQENILKKKKTETKKNTRQINKNDSIFM